MGKKLTWEKWLKTPEGQERVKQFMSLDMKCKCGKPATMTVSVMGVPENLCDDCWAKGVERGKQLLAEHRAKKVNI